ncbi:MAG TPA: helix-turn-helix transcriptional regulator [Noviherbaspirillum sp.]
MNDEANNTLLTLRRMFEEDMVHDPGTQGIPEWLAAGIQHAGVHVTIVAQRAYRLRALAIDQPALILPLAGTKRVELGTARAQLAAGEFLMIHQAIRLQVENIPPAHTGKAYCAWAIPFPWRIVELARALLNAHSVPAAYAPLPHGSNRPLSFSSGSIAGLLPTLKQLLELLTSSNASDAALIDHALLGVLIALARNGHSHFLLASDPSVSARIRLLVASAPEREWNSADFEEVLHMSGATLRRRLAEENSSLRALLREARLHHGLVLLQTSRKPLKAIAQACGYRSAPSFTRNFIDHFGVEPSAIAIR